MKQLYALLIAALFVFSVVPATLADDSDGRLRIQVEFDDGSTDVKVEHGDVDNRYTLFIQDKDEIIDEIAAREDLSEADILAVIEWEHDDDSEDDERHKSSDDSDSRDAFDDRSSDDSFDDHDSDDDSNGRFRIKAEFEDGITKVKVEYADDSEVRYELATQVRSEVVSQIARKEGMSEEDVLDVIRWEVSDDNSFDDSDNSADDSTGRASIKIDDPSSGALVSGAVRVKVEWDGRVEYAVITIKGADGGELSERITTEQTVGFDLDTIQGDVAGITVRGYVGDEEVASDAIRVRLTAGADLNDDRLNNGRDDPPARDDTCAGCDDGELCYQIGTRVKQEGVSMYCEVDGTLQAQKAVGAACENNFECSTNQCSSGACIDLSAELAENRSLMQRILSFIDRLFN